MWRGQAARGFTTGWRCRGNKKRKSLNSKIKSLKSKDKYFILLIFGKIIYEFYLFVDGSNLYAGQYELFGPKKYLDFFKYINSIENSLNIKFEKIYFYASYSPRPKLINNKIKKYLINEYNFYKRVKSIKNLIFFKGYRSPTSGKEKEVDVKIAVDIVNMAHLNKYTNLYLMSGDADFLHALKVAESLRKWITIVALENRIPFRYSYLYKTYVFKFKEKLKIKIKKSQKIKIIKLENKITQFV